MTYVSPSHSSARSVRQRPSQTFCAALFAAGLLLIAPLAKAQQAQERLRSEQVDALEALRRFTDVPLLPARGSEPFWNSLRATRDLPPVVNGQIRPAGQGSGKIIGGEVAPSGANPWQVALLVASETRNVPFCGGSLIAQTWVLTAAHCVDRDTTTADVEVLAGTDNIRSGGQRLRVSRIVRHASYVSAPLGNDVALLLLERAAPGTPIQLVSTANEAALLQEGQNEDASTQLRTTGWGATAEGGDTVWNLRTVTVPFVSLATCNDNRSYRGRISPGMLCAGSNRGGRDSCQGDSGGPLTIAVGSERRLVGVVSWGEGCGRAWKYGIYTQVTSFERWIAENMR
ncbi:S1 family peptidase [Falsiroseomonas sp. HW251]|uniref:S1 family peptidase n=1 Tax=Falsiroseomonas sp. HW251 TaxID=3390998 RepID=UPI003D31C1A9